MDTKIALTRDEIMRLDGRALDAVVATTFGMPFYYSDWRAMGDLVAEMQRRGWQWHGGDGNGPNRGLQKAMFDHYDPLTVADAVGETLPTATARAALLAVMEVGVCAKCGGPLQVAGYARWYCDICHETTDACGKVRKANHEAPPL